MTRYSKSMREVLFSIREGYSPKEIKMAIGIANDPRYKGGNYDGAVDAIEKIKKGLSNHKQVAAVLKRLNTGFEQEGETLDEALPPHLAKLFDKDGNFKDPKKQKVFDRMMGDGIGKEIAQKMGRIKFRVQADSAKKKVMVYVDQNDESDAQKALKNHPAYVSGALRVIPEAVNLDEGTWAIPDSPKAKAELKKLMSKPIKLGKEGDDASDAMYSLIGDDELMDDLYVAGKKNPNGDARPIIKKAMKRLGIKEEVELEEKLGKDADAGDYIDDFKKSDAPQFKGKSDKKKKDMAIAAYLDAKDKKEEVELDEAVKYQFVAIDRLGKVIGFASDEKDAKDMARRGHTMDSPSKGKGVVGRNKAKVVKLKKPMSDKKGDMMINRDFDMNKFGGETTYSVGLKEEDKPDKPDSAKAVDQARDDKKKTRIAQLQLQIAKASEMINKLNSQEKPDA